MFLLLVVSIAVSGCNWKPGRCYTGGSATESPLWGPGNQADCEKECAKYGADHGAEVCCKFGWRSSPSEKRTCYVHLNSYRTYDEQSFNDRDNRVCMTGSKDSPGGLGYEKISSGSICNAGYWLKDKAKATKNQCAAECETTDSCNTFCWSDSSPESDCLMYTSCKSIGHFNSDSSTSSYGCYRKPHTPTCYEECMERYDDGFSDIYIGGNSQIQKDCRASCNMAQRSFHPPASSGTTGSSKLHTIDQEYHMKEMNSDAAWQKDEDWSKKERREKGEDAVGYLAETAVVATAEGESASFVLYGFAAIGLGFLFYGAGKHYTKESTQIYSEA